MYNNNVQTPTQRNTMQCNACEGTIVVLWSARPLVVGMFAGLPAQPGQLGPPARHSPSMQRLAGQVMHSDRPVSCHALDLLLEFLVQGLVALIHPVPPPAEGGQLQLRAVGQGRAQSAGEGGTWGEGISSGEGGVL
jgi:hypothetical protein